MDDFSGTLENWLAFPVTPLDINHEIVDGRLVISSEEVAGNFDGSIMLNLPSVSDPEQYSEGTLRATVRTVDTNVILYFRGNIADDTAYALAFRPTDGFLILSKTWTGGEEFLATTFVRYGNHEDLVLEISAIGSVVSASIWSVDEEKPSQATLTAHDASYDIGAFALAVDGPSVINQPVPLYVEFDDVWFIPAGAPSDPADLNGDGVVDGADLGILLSAWGQEGPGDLNGDGTVDGADLGLLLAAWG